MPVIAKTTRFPHCGKITAAGDQLNPPMLNDIKDSQGGILEAIPEIRINNPLSMLGQGPFRLPFEIVPGFTRFRITIEFKLNRSPLGGPGAQNSDLKIWVGMLANPVFIQPIRHYFYSLADYNTARQLLGQFPLVADFPPYTESVGGAAVFRVIEGTFDNNFFTTVPGEIHGGYIGIDHHFPALQQTHDPMQWDHPETGQTFPYGGIASFNFDLMI